MRKRHQHTTLFPLSQAGKKASQLMQISSTRRDWTCKFLLIFFLSLCWPSLAVLVCLLASLRGKSRMYRSSPIYYMCCERVGRKTLGQSQLYFHETVRFSGTWGATQYSQCGLLIRDRIEAKSNDGLLWNVNFDDSRKTVWQIAAIVRAYDVFMDISLCPS